MREGLLLSPSGLSSLETFFFHSIILQNNKVLSDFHDLLFNI